MKKLEQQGSKGNVIIVYFTKYFFDYFHEAPLNEVYKEVNEKVPRVAFHLR